MLHQFFGFRGRISRATYWLLVVLWIAFGPIGMTFVLWAAPIGNTKLDSIVLSVLIVAVVIGIVCRDWRSAPSGYTIATAAGGGSCCSTRCRPRSGSSPAR